MKHIKRIYLFLIVLPVIVTGIAYMFLPDRIPAHFGFDNQVTRWGSKAEVLIFPAIIIIFGLIMYLVAKVSAKKEGGQQAAKTMLLAMLFVLIIFNMMNIYFLYVDFNQVTNLSKIPVDLGQLEFGVMAIALFGWSFLLPKLPQNAWIGLRTPWTMRNKTVWQLSQQFAGKVFRISGILMLLACLFTKGVRCAVVNLVILIVAALVCTVYSYRIERIHRYDD